MSDSGRQMGECSHGETGFCRACLRELLKVKHDGEIEAAVRELIKGAPKVVEQKFDSEGYVEAASVITHPSGNRDGCAVKVMVKMSRAMVREEDRQAAKFVREFEEKLTAKTMALRPEHAEKIKNERADFEHLFADYGLVYVETVDSPYPETEYGKLFPWYIFTTRRGHVMIGYRRDVIEINWNRSTVRITANILFPHDDVTKGDYHIHAWSIAQAKSFIDKIMTVKVL